MSFKIEDGKLIVYSGSDEEVVIPEGVTKIGYEAFHGGSSLGRENTTMKKCVLPDSVKEIGDSAFYCAKALETINIPRNVTSIDGSAFFLNTSMKEVHIHSIESWLKIEISRNGNPLESGASIVIDGKRLEDLTIPDGTSEIGQYAFCGANITTASLPESITSIGASAFANCGNLRKINIPAHVETIGNFAFYRTGITEIKIPKSVKSIGEYAFANCVNPITVEFEALVEAVGKDAFAGCPDGSMLIFPKDTFVVKSALPIGLSSGNVEISDKEAAYIMVYQKAKAWKTAIAQKCDAAADEIFGNMIDIFAVEKKAAAPVAEFLENHATKISQEKAKQAVKMLKEKKYKDVDRLVKIPEVKDCLAGKKHVENPIEEKLRGYLETIEILPEILSVVKKGIPYAEDGRLSSREAVAFVISEYMREWKKRKSVVQGETMSIDVLTDGTTVEKRKEADKIAAGLDRKELITLLDALIERREYRNYLLAWARYADDDCINRNMYSYRSMLRGKAVEKYKAGNMREALVLSDEEAARNFFENIGMLNHYMENRD